MSRGKKEYREIGCIVGIFSENSEDSVSQIVRDIGKSDSLKNSDTPILRNIELLTCRVFRVFRTTARGGTRSRVGKLSDTAEEMTPAAVWLKGKLSDRE